MCVCIAFDIVSVLFTLFLLLLLFQLLFFLFFVWTQKAQITIFIRSHGKQNQKNVQCAFKQVKYYMPHKRKMHILCLLTPYHVCVQCVLSECRNLWCPQPIARTHSFAAYVSHFTSLRFVVNRVCLNESVTIIFYVHSITNTSLWYHFEWWELRMWEIIKKIARTHTHTHTHCI